MNFRETLVFVLGRETKNATPRSLTSLVFIKYISFARQAPIIPMINATFVDRYFVSQASFKNLFTSSGIKVAAFLLEIVPIFSSIGSVVLVKFQYLQNY